MCPEHAIEIGTKDQTVYNLPHDTQRKWEYNEEARGICLDLFGIGKLSCSPICIAYFAGLCTYTYVLIYLP